MQISNTGLNYLKTAEGFRATPYYCQGGVLTIGYGHTKNVKSTDIVTVEEAEKLLMEDLEAFVNNVNNKVTVQLTQNMFDSLVLLSFNIGITAFNNSTLLKKLNLGDYTAAADQFLVWNKVTVNGVKKESAGLTARRKEEKELFIYNMYTDIYYSTATTSTAEEITIPNLKGYTGVSIVDGLKEYGYPYSFEYRKHIAAAVGISNYTGSETENLKLLKILTNSAINIPSLKGYKGFSIVDGLKQFGYPYSIEYRKEIAAAVGISNYTGTSIQNTKLLNILKTS